MKINAMKTKLTKFALNRKPVLIVGAPGVGKTDLVKQVAEEAGMDLIITHPVVADPTDAKGLPGIVDGQAEFLPYGDLRKMMKATKPTIVFLDDLGQAAPVVQAAYMQLILGREINGHAISDTVCFFAATNRREDKAGVNGILEPVKSRFKTIYNLEADATEWIAWAMENGMPPELIGFIHMRPALIHDFVPSADMTNSPCPRTIANAGDCINMELTDIETLTGCVGAGMASELTQFLKVANDLPNLDQIELDPVNTKVPTKPDAQYALIGALTNRVNEDNIEAIVTYGIRLNTDIAACFIRDMLLKDKEATAETAAFKTWITKHRDILL